MVHVGRLAEAFVLSRAEIVHDWSLVTAANDVNPRIWRALMQRHVWDGSVAPHKQAVVATLKSHFAEQARLGLTLRLEARAAPQSPCAPRQG
jgi:hypothetical protein